MNEVEKIEYAKSFIDKLASGINPLDETPIPEGAVINTEIVKGRLKESDCEDTEEGEE